MRQTILNCLGSNHRKPALEGLCKLQPTYAKTTYPCVKKAGWVVRASNASRMRLSRRWIGYQ